MLTNFQPRSNEVMIIGNGVSRLIPELKKAIDGYNPLNDFWCCNWSLREFWERTTLWTGHQELYSFAEKLIETSKKTFRILSGVASGPKYVTPKCSRKYWRDSGTTLVAEALALGYQGVVVAGMDLGGPDMYSPNWAGCKTVWVRRWYQLFMDYGTDRVRFLGQDHLPVIMHPERHKEYHRLLAHSHPHITYPGYKAIYLQYAKEVPRSEYQTSLRRHGFIEKRNDDSRHVRAPRPRRGLGL